MSEVLVFLGPTLPASEAAALVDAEIRGPARQGDVWRALEQQPRAIVLIDGVFEAQPSVWHRELLAALEAGVAVFGASSMGALRAAELQKFGMRGVGKIFESYASGARLDDADVALLHGDAESGHRPLTVPLVNAEHAIAQVARRKKLSAAEAEALLSRARATFYQDRTWPQLLEALELSPQRRRSLGAALAKFDLKRDDAVRCLRLVSAFLRGRQRPKASRAPAVATSLARVRRLREGSSRAPNGRVVANAEVLSALGSQGAAGAWTDAGLRRLLLVGLARSLGWSAEPAEIAEAERRWLEGLGVPEEERETFLAAAGLDEASARSLAEELALEQRVLRHADRMISDGPSALEALASETRLNGVWADAVRRWRKPR